VYFRSGFLYLTADDHVRPRHHDDAFPPAAWKGRNTALRVLHVFKTYLPDSFTGIERVIWQICRATAPHGVRSHVFCLSDRPAGHPLKLDGHWVHQARTTVEHASTPVSLTALPKFCALARRMDLVHYHFPWPMSDLFHLASRHGKPSLVTYHSDIVRQARLLRLYAPLMHRFLGSVDAIVATSPNYARTSPVLARYQDKLGVVPIGLDVPTPPAQALVEAWRRRLPPRFFLFVGVLRYYKGLDFLLEAARRSGLPIVIAGRGQLPPAQQQALPANVHLVGEVSEADKAALLALCDTFVFPSHLRSEAFGIALLEAAFAGKALISCEVGSGTSYVNADGETGLVVPPADAGALAAAMQQLWSEPEQAARMGAAAARRARALFSASTMGASYAALYGRLLQG
jgi:rhamnosyl/mannosyltransferase